MFEFKFVMLSQAALGFWALGKALKTRAVWADLWWQDGIVFVVYGHSRVVGVSVTGTYWVRALSNGMLFKNSCLLKQPTWQWKCSRWLMFLCCLKGFCATSQEKWKWFLAIKCAGNKTKQCLKWFLQHQTQLLIIIWSLFYHFRELCLMSRTKQILCKKTSFGFLKAKVTNMILL